MLFRSELIAGTQTGANGEDLLIVDDEGETTDTASSGAIGASSVTGFGIAAGGGVIYNGFEDLTLALGSKNDTLFIDNTHTGTTRVIMGDETAVTNTVNDRIIVRGTRGPTIINAGTGNDEFRVNYLADGYTQTFQNNIAGELTLHGQIGRAHV